MTTAQRIEFGDFQTPAALAQRACAVLRGRGVKPAVIIEPTCGIGNFLLAAAEEFAECTNLVGLEVNEEHHQRLQERLTDARLGDRVETIRDDFFTFSWSNLRSRHNGPPLIVGNPPWVTVAGLGAIQGQNAPRRANADGLSGMDAKTGKSNFDIAEWIVLRLLSEFERSGGTMAMLLKTSVARRVLGRAWRSAIPIGNPTLYLIDAKASFGVSADAGFLVFDLPDLVNEHVCRVASLDEPERQLSAIGWRQGAVVADVDAYDETAAFGSHDKPPASLRWRSGIKHDCSEVLELTRVGSRRINGRGDAIELEADVLYPMLKGADVANGDVSRRDLWMLVPQTATGQDTARLAAVAPSAWDYLQKHRRELDARKSSIYRGRAPFAIFGVGPYSFQNWKIAICGLYKQLRFTLVPPRESRPVVFDDTVYHLSFDTRDVAEQVIRCLHSEIAKRFFDARIFRDSKRPVTAALLNQLDLQRLAMHLGVDIGERDARSAVKPRRTIQQPSLFAE